MSTGLLIGSIVAAVFVVIAAASAAAETAMTRISRARANGFDHEAHPGAAALVEVLGERETTLAPLLLSRVALFMLFVLIAIAPDACSPAAPLPLGERAPRLAL